MEPTGVLGKGARQLPQSWLIKCRLCFLAEEGSLLDLFSEEATKLKILSKLNIHCSLIVTEDDCLSRLICFSCLSEVNRFSDFYNRVQENQKLFANLPVVKKDDPEEKFEVIKIDYDDVGKVDIDSEESCTYIVSEVQSEGEGSEEESAIIIKSGSNEEQEKTREVVKEQLGDTYDIQASQDDRQVCNESDVQNLDAKEKDKPIEADEEAQEIHSREIASTIKIISDEDGSNLVKNIAEKSSRKWLKNALKFSKNKEGLKNLLEQYNAKSKVLILPSQKSSHRISLDEPIREFFDLSCPHCDFAFLTFVTMKKHMESAHNEQGFVICCNKKLYRREAVMEHINFHLDPNKFVCHICKQICKSKVTLKVHLKQHIPEDQRPFRCQTCGQSFVLSSQLKSHEKSHLSDDEKKYVCEKCGKAFAFKFVLEKHKQHKHIRQKNFMCEICAKSFVDKVNLTAHKRTHDNTLPRVQCPHCDALLKNKITLKIHMRTHNQESHSCSKCDKVLSTKNALMNHMQYVHGGKRYPCTVCQKVFKKTLTLKEHMTTHTGEVLYKCQYCDKSFNAKANMYAHVKKVHTSEWAEQRKLKWGLVN